MRSSPVRRVEFTEKLTDGSIIYVRPINPGDLELERSFVDGLSKQSKYYRFLGGISRLTEDELRRFCDVDRQHEMAFIALDGDGSQVGVARYVADKENSAAEIAVTVADQWQGKGVDDVLLRHLIDYARSCGIKRLFSIELAVNTDMYDLARRFGFDVKSDPGDSTQVINRLDLTASA
jgi:N-acetylglutamate synthase-like GNAT family acetyltransferase